MIKSFESDFTLRASPTRRMELNEILSTRSICTHEILIKVMVFFWEER